MTWTVNMDSCYAGYSHPPSGVQGPCMPMLMYDNMSAVVMGVNLEARSKTFHE